MKNFFIYDSHESIEERKNVKEFVDMVGHRERT